MKRTCETPVSEELLVAYFARDLDEASSSAVEEHIFSCASCTAEAERIALIASTLREMIPFVVSRDQLAKLRARGLKIVENPVQPSVRSPFVFPASIDVAIHALRGLDLGRATNVAIKVVDDDTQNVMTRLDKVPFDPSAGEILIACQKHFVDFPPNVVFEVTATLPDGVVETRFSVPHLIDPAG